MLPGTMTGTKRSKMQLNSDSSGGKFVLPIYSYKYIFKVGKLDKLVT